MTITIAQLDEMPDAEVAFKLAACCGSARWVAEMLTRRPFGSRGHLVGAAVEVAASLREPDWLEAFTHHPKIGQRISNAVVSTSAESWSTGEQSAVASASTAIRAALADANDEYAQRFGFIFIICASGRSATEILAALRARMGNTREKEIFVAAGEQQQITRLRLEKLVAPDEVGA